MQIIRAREDAQRAYSALTPVHFRQIEAAVEQREIAARKLLRTSVLASMSVVKWRMPHFTIRNTHGHRRLLG